MIVGVSGGPDSVALLHLLGSGLPELRLVAVYVDHGLRPAETGAESALVQDLANKIGAGFERVAIDVQTTAKEQKRSIEDAARLLRYQALEAARQRYQGKAIAVAHTADDQAEELLIRLIRGSGRKGLAGMEARNGHIIRPLLRESKDTLLHYLESRQLPFCLDSSNLERTYLRNRVRLDLIPFLEQHFNPSIRQALLQTTEILTDEENLLDQLTNTAWQEMVCIEPPPSNFTHTTPPQSLHIVTSSFCACPLAIQRRIVEKCCIEMKEQPQFQQISLLLHLFHQGQAGAEIHLSKGLRATKKKGVVIFCYPTGKGPFRGRL